jgi:hypothetical protein
LPQRFTDLLGGRSTAVFLGEAGSGKSEIAINFALGLKGENDRRIHFFDMDQTKPLFRSRDVAEQMRRAGVVFHSNSEESIEDVASVPPGVVEAISEPDSFVILDIGGNERGARMIGQYHQYLNREDCRVFFVINPYCAWSKDYPGIAATIHKISGASRIEQIHIVSNPNFGAETTAEDVITGHARLKGILEGQLEIAFVCAMEHLYGALQSRIEETLIPITRFIRYPWQDTCD